MEKVLSVSIAAYNVEKYLKETLDSFLTIAEAGEVEVLIVNDGSSDSTKEIAQKYCDMYPQTFILVDKENGGWGSTLNVGIEKAHGKYFKQLDGDDYFDSENLSEFIEFLKSKNVDLVYTPFVSFDDKTGTEVQRFFISNKRYPMQRAIKFDRVASGLPFAMHSCTWRTSLLKDKKIRVMEKCFYTDKEFILRAAIETRSVCFYNKVIYCYRVARDGQSMSAIGFQKHYKDLLKTVDTYIDLYHHVDMLPGIKKLFREQSQIAVDLSFSAFYLFIPARKYRNELRDFYQHLKNDAPEFAKITNTVIRIDQKFNFAFYPLIVHVRRLLKK